MALNAGTCMGVEKQVGMQLTVAIQVSCTGPKGFNKGTELGTPKRDPQECSKNIIGI